MLEINLTTKEKVSYSDFVIAKEHKFFRNIFSEDELSSSDALKNIRSYHENFSRFLKIVVYLQQSLNSIQEFADCVYDNLIQFCGEFCKDCDDFSELKDRISDVTIKSKRTTKISKFTLKLYAFVYQRIMKFPQNKFEFETVATNDLFENIHKIINVKVHLHHSHVTGEVIGYAHDFCNLKVRENKDVISCIVHNFFGFDIYFFLKAIRLSAWKTKDINIGGTGLTNVSFASIDQLKLIDTMKYFQTSLGKLAETLSADEKRAIQKLTVQFLTTHSHFSKVWKELSSNQKNKVIEIIIGGKGIIPYEKIESIDSLEITPEDGIFFSKDEFFSTLKGKMVDDESYENSKKLYILLKMKNLSDLNDLYNAQDVIILLEIIENRFQSM